MRARMHIAQRTLNGAEGLDQLEQVSFQHHIDGRSFPLSKKDDCDEGGSGSGDGDDDACQRAKNRIIP